MTNYEFYKDEIIELILSNRVLAVDKRTGKPVICAELDCDCCKFNNEKIECEQGRKEWLKAEYVEIPKLTKKERLLCELFEYGYITYSPVKDSFVWTSMDVKWDGCRMKWYTIDKNDDYKMLYIWALDDIPSIKSKDMFGFIKESGKAWNVGVLLQLEVVEE